MEFEVDIRANGFSKRIVFPISNSKLNYLFECEVNEVGYEIEEYFFPMNLGISPSIEKLNSVAYKMDEVPQYLKNLNVLRDVEFETGWTFDEFVENIEHISFIEGNRASVGHFLKDEIGIDPPDRYYDYDAFGKFYLDDIQNVNTGDGFILLE